MRFRRKPWSDEELRALHHSELDALLLEKDTDAETILRVLKLLRAQTPPDPVDTERAWQDFQALYNTLEGQGHPLYPSASAAVRRKRPSPRILAAAAACLALLALPQGWAGEFTARLERLDAQAAAEDSRRELADAYLRYREEQASDRMMRFASEQ